MARLLHKLLTSNRFLLIYETPDLALMASRQYGYSAGLAALPRKKMPERSVFEAALSVKEVQRYFAAKKITGQIWFSEPDDVFLVLQNEKIKDYSFVKVLHRDRVGWIFNVEAIAKIREVK